MKRFFCFTAAALCAALSMQAQSLTSDLYTATAQEDSLIYQLQAIEVVATTPSVKAAPATTTMTKEELSKNNYGFDVPTLLMNMPSVLSTSETGIGIGGTSMRIRGTDATRISVTVNGMSLNDPDSHAMYWYDTPDLSGSTGKVQVVRGAGTTTNGTGAFGGAINISTAALSNELCGDVNVSYGSYNTNKQSVHIGSGLLGNHWIVDLRLSHIGSDGYIDRASTDMKSYMFQAAYMDTNSMLKLVSFGGKSKTYLTYNGVTPEEMDKMGRTYHTSGQYKTSDGPFYNKKGEKVNYFDDQTDNYLQINNQLIYDRFFGRNWSMNAMLYYTYGNGYYRQYKDDAWLCGYNNIVSSWDQADLIRRKTMVNHRGGANINGVFSNDKVNVTFGAAYMFYACPHYGTIDWIDGQDQALYNGFRWYDNDVRKNDANIYVKADYMPVKGLTIHGELQYRLVSYKAWGTNDNYDWNKYVMQPIEVNKLWNFFNPNISVNYDFCKYHSVNASFAMANKEPTRADFTDRYNFSVLSDQEPKPERLFDYELAYNFKHPIAQAGINLYYMQYKDQLVPTGIINDSEDNLNINVDKSFRRGIELTLGVSPLKWFSLGGNCTLSQNKIVDYDEVIGDTTIHHDLADIAYSPSVIGNAFIDFHTHGFEGRISTQYIGKQYISNGSHDDLSLPGYCTANIDLGYTLPQELTKARIRLGIRIANFTNTLYNSYGYGGSYIYEGKRGSWMYVFPQAPCNAIGNITVSF